MAHDLASVADNQLAAFIDRILRMREEERAIKADIREIYAEAKATGHDKTVMGKIVNYIEKRETAAADLQEAEALFEIYLTAYDRSKGRVGTSFATHVHEDDPDYDPVTGEILDTNPAPSIPHVPVGGPTEAQPLSEAESDAAPSVASAPITETHHGETGASPVSAGAQAAGELVEPGSSVVAFPKLKMNPEFFEAPHPACKRPSFCGGNSNLGLCESCKIAAGMIQVEPGGTAIQHQGSVG